ncbi:MAG: V-type ATP synthase subunit E family protein [Sphaerochaetaceae bacterium]
MALQIQDLVASIRKDGVQAAQKDAQKIVADAEKQAEVILQQAHKEADALQDEARREIDVRDQSARASLQQASRDVLLSLRKAISTQLELLLQAKLEKAFSGKELEALVVAIVKSGVVDTSESEVQLNSKQFASLASQLMSELSQELKNGLEIKPVDNVDTGFRIADKDGSGFIDFSDEEIANLMKPFLSDELSKIVFAQAK